MREKVETDTQMAHSMLVLRHYNVILISTSAALMKVCSEGIGEWRYKSTVTNLGSEGKWVICFTPRPFHPWVKSHNYPMQRRLLASQSRYGR
jgi:hypothetical protein